MTDDSNENSVDQPFFGSEEKKVDEIKSPAQQQLADESIKAGLRNLSERQTSLDVRSHLARLAQNREQVEGGQYSPEALPTAEALPTDSPEDGVSLSATLVPEVDMQPLQGDLVQANDTAELSESASDLPQTERVLKDSPSFTEVSDPKEVGSPQVSPLNPDSQIGIPSDRFNAECEALFTKSNWRELCLFSEGFFASAGLEQVARLWWVTGQLEQEVVPLGLLSGPAESALKQLAEQKSSLGESSKKLGETVAVKMAQKFDEDQLYLQSLPLWEIAALLEPRHKQGLAAAAEKQLELDKKAQSKRERKAAFEREDYLNRLTGSSVNQDKKPQQKRTSIESTDWKLGVSGTKVADPEDVYASSLGASEKSHTTARAMFAALLLLTSLVGYELLSLDKGRMWSFVTTLGEVLPSGGTRSKGQPKIREPFARAEVDAVPQLALRSPTFEQIPIKSQFGLGTILKGLESSANSAGSGDSSDSMGKNGSGNAASKPAVSKRQAATEPQIRPSAPEVKLPEPVQNREAPPEPEYVDRAIDAYDRGGAIEDSSPGAGGGYYDRGGSYDPRGRQPEPKPSSPYMVQGEPIPRMPDYYDEEDRDDSFEPSYGNFYQVTEGVEVREAPYDFAPSIARLRPNSRVEVESEFGSWLKIISENGRPGFIPRYSARPSR
jgi:hypothetical protein